MTKKTKLKLLFITVILGSMLLSVANGVIPNVHAAEATAREKALSILNDVVGLNTSAYTAHLNSDVNATMLGLPQEDTNFNFNSAQGSLRTRVVFTNNSLRQLYISDYAGLPSLTQPATNAVDMAKGFLERCQSYTGNSFYSQLNSMLDGVAANTNVTKVVGNVKLEVSIVGDQVEEDFVWTYVDANGVSALSKNVILSYYHGFLQSFLDNWQFYKIAGVPKISSQDAVAEALKAVESFSYMVHIDSDEDVAVSGFKVVSIGDVTLSYLNYKEETPTQSVRGSDPHMLYPSWYVPLGFDKFYPGSVTGAIVRVWADTGEVSTVDPMVFGVMSSVNGTETEDSVVANQAPTIAVLLAFAVTVVSGTVGFYSFVFGNEHLGLKHKWKMSLSKLGTTLLCTLILSSLIMMTIPRVNATQLKSEIYASLHYELSNEIDLADSVEDDIYSDFQAAGVDTAYNWATLTTRSNILSHIDYDNSHYAGVTVFHWGHGYYDYYDNNGDLVSPSNISDTMQGNTTHYFIMMWTCHLAEAGPYSGFPNAWTQTSLGPSNWDGYSNSNNAADHCFIGFSGASPCLGSGSFNDSSAVASDFIVQFYDYAVNQGYTVHDALNQASNDENIFSLPYAESPLYRGVGYYTWWAYNPNFPDMNETWYPGHMEVFGDSNIHLLPYADVSDAAEWEYYGGWVDDAENLNGGSNDGNFAHIHCPNYYPENDMAMIIATLDKETSGHIAIYGRSGEGYYSDLLVYVADEYPSENWECVNSLTITQSSPYWISIGDFSGNFRYIAVVGYDSQNSVCLYLDSVRVTP
jgi:hypothetical protein